jgi:arylsulfatase A-like enzyme
MKKRLLLLFCFAALLAGCKREEGLHKLDLIQLLPYAEHNSDTQVLVFGTTEGKRSQLAGWGEVEKQGNESYQWAVNRSAAFFFNISKTQPLYLHLKIGSFFPNRAQLLINKKPLRTIEIPEVADVVSVAIPENVLQEKTNVIELLFDELRKSRKPDPRDLAAAAYFAVLTPAKYISDMPGSFDWNGKVDSIILQKKNRAAFVFPAGGSLRFYEKLNRNSVLQFGSYYRPSAMSEDDDFARFTVTVRTANGKSMEIYKKDADSSTYDFRRISLARFVLEEKSAVHEIEFHLQRNSILDNGRAAWIEPALFLNSERQSDAPDLEQIETLRRNNNRANVVLIILDAAGAKHVSSYGYFRKTTPNIDELAAHGIRFEQAHTQAVYTLASTASLMSGLDPFNHRIILRRSKLPQHTITLAERFRDGGYDTGTFVANGNASSIFGMTQGFQEVGEVFREPNYSGWGKDITNRFTGWLGKVRAKPFFAYLHYREPHAPFNPPDEFKKQFTDPNYQGLKDASYERRQQINMGEGGSNQAERDYITATYDENLHYGDYEVGRVIAKLKELGVFDNTILVVTSDHGEAFWEHGFQGHNSQLYEESVRIPLVIKLTRNSGIKEKVVNSTVRTIDLYPTLVDLLNLSRRDMRVDGKSFIPYFLSAADDERGVMSQIIEERGYSFKEDGYKFIIHLASRKEELYNLADDPQELKNLVEREPVRAHYMRSRIFGWMASNKRIGRWQKTEKATIDDTTRENLKALGYVDE